MRNKTNKLIQLERHRYSILTEDLEHCFLCGQKKNDIHEVYGGSNRQQSMKYGFCVPLCRFHHQVVTMMPLHNRQLQIWCQSEFEKTHTRKEFMDIIGKNYL